MARSGRASSDLTRLVLLEYGTVCWLCGRDGANSKDHVIPYSLGGSDDIDNLRPAHSLCNKRRGNRIVNGYGARIRVVMGPPASGKTAYVTEHASSADIVVDLDAIARALMPYTPERTHVYPQHVRHVAIGARAAAIDRAVRMASGVGVWIIHADPTHRDIDDYRFLRYEVITIDPGRAIVEERVRTERPPYMRAYVPKWYTRHGSAPAVAAPAEAPELVEADW